MIMRAGTRQRRTHDSDHLVEAVLGATKTPLSTYDIRDSIVAGGDRISIPQIYRVVARLVANAIKFTENGSIKIVGERRGDTVAISISDTGIGIPENALARIFEGFYQVDHRLGRRHQGAGIGLTLVDRLVRLMGGEITVRSTVGTGSTFTFTLPVAS